MEQPDPPVLNRSVLSTPVLKISFEKALHLLDIEAGTAITIYLHPAEGEVIEVELHVDHSGVPRVLVCKEDMNVVKTFEDVYG